MTDPIVTAALALAFVLALASYPLAAVVTAVVALCYQIFLRVQV